MVSASHPADGDPSQLLTTPTPAYSGMSEWSISSLAATVLTWQTPAGAWIRSNPRRGLSSITRDATGAQMLSAVVCSGAGRGQGTAFEDFGEEPGGGGEMLLVPGPYVPPQVGEADLQLVAVVAYGSVDESALVGS